MGLFLGGSPFMSISPYILAGLKMRLPSAHTRALLPALAGPTIASTLLKRAASSQSSCQQILGP